AVGVVLHDLGHAAAVADHVVLLDRGRIRSVGTCEDVFTADVLSEVYGLPMTTRIDEDTGLVRVEALHRRTRRAAASSRTAETDRCTRPPCTISTIDRQKEDHEQDTP